MAQNPLEIKRKIILTIKSKGPGLPVQIARSIEMSPLFASAFLAELVSEKQLKISSMKVGGSPLYLLPGQEPMLEKFLQYIKGKEKEALLLLKQKKFLSDESQEPAIRVALRSLKDFALPFKHEEKIFWRYFTTPISEFKPEAKKIEKKYKKDEKIVRPETRYKPAVEISSNVTKEKQKILESEKPLISLKRKKEKKSGEKPSFVLKILEIISSKDIELLEEIETKKKEFIGKGRINSDLGKIEFLIIAKDKKKITKNDISTAVQRGNEERLAVIFICHGTIDKKAEPYLNKYKNMVKFLNV